MQKTMFWLCRRTIVCITSIQLFYLKIRDIMQEDTTTSTHRLLYIPQEAVKRKSGWIYEYDNKKGPDNPKI